MGLDFIGKILSKGLYIPMILVLIANEWLFENSAEERTKQQVGTLPLSRPYSVTEKNDGIKLGKRKKEGDEETK